MTCRFRGFDNVTSPPSTGIMRLGLKLPGRGFREGKEDTWTAWSMLNVVVAP